MYTDDRRNEKRTHRNVSVSKRYYNERESKTCRVKEQNPNRVIGAYDNLSLHDVKRTLQSLMKVAFSASIRWYLVHGRGCIDAK